MENDRQVLADEPKPVSPKELPDYRPVSSAATISLFVGLFAMLAAVLVADVGIATFIGVAILGLLIGLRGLSSIKRYDMAGLGFARAGLGLSVLALFTGAGVHLYESMTEVPEGSVLITYAALQPKGGEMIPDSAKALDGKKVFIKGYMYPGDQTKGIKEFVLCRDNGTCCFGGQPKLTDMIQVQLKEPLTVDFHSGLRHIAGNFKVEQSIGPSSVGTVLYKLEADYAR